MKSISLENTFSAKGVLTVIQVFAASCLLALASQVSFFLPYTPVFVSMQTAALFLIGVTLGPVKGAAAVLLYLMEGALGLPVFALGQSGIGVLLGPQGGYLAGFLPAVMLSGFLSKRSLLGAFFLSNVAIYALGLPWLSLFVGDQAFAMGLSPFIIGDLLKIGASAAIIRGINSCK